MDPKLALLGLLVLLTIVYVAGWVTEERRRGRGTLRGESGPPDAWRLGTGFVTNFFDTLGIGSFATTTAIFRARRMVRDELIPGTLNVGHALAVVAQALIYIVIIEVDIVTLVSMIAASVAGAWLGAGIVSGWPPRNVQVGMGLCLLAAAALMAMSQLGLAPGGGTTLALTGIRLALGVAGNFVLGALMALGIGLYAPCLILVSLLGMNPTAGFPIMMGSCAFLMPVGGLRFIRNRAYDLRAALGLTLGGIPAVLLAAYIVKSLPLTAVRWLVVVVVVYTAVTMLRAAVAEATRVGRAAPAP